MYFSNVLPDSDSSSVDELSVWSMCKLLTVDTLSLGTVSAEEETNGTEISSLIWMKFKKKQLIRYKTLK